MDSDRLNRFGNSFSAPRAPTPLARLSEIVAGAGQTFAKNVAEYNTLVRDPLLLPMANATLTVIQLYETCLPQLADAFRSLPDQ